MIAARAQDPGQAAYAGQLAGHDVVDLFARLLDGLVNARWQLVALARRAEASVGRRAREWGRAQP